LERGKKVRLFEQMRREYEHGVGTVQGVSKKFGVHRRMVRQALKDAMPPERKRPERTSPKLEPVKGYIEKILEEDKRAPRKQRHTAHRIFNRIAEKYPEHSIGESTVRRYVSRRKRELGLKDGEVYVPQSYEWGREGQVDWYEAVAELGGERQTVQVFTMRSMAGGGALHRAYPRPTQQAFFEGHELSFSYFGGVFHKLRYDNLGLAVKKILRGYQRDQTAKFVGFRSHWGFESEFCNPSRGNEKGGVESEVGYFRRNHWTPIPKVEDWEELNRYLLECCRRDESRRVGEREFTVGIGMQLEKPFLLPLAREGFEVEETVFPVVDKKGCVKVSTNWYSTPLRRGVRVQAKLKPLQVEVWYEGRLVAHHERSYRRGQQILDLEHYLDVLERKPGALAGSTPLAQWRERGRWPQSYDRMLEALVERHGKLDGTRKMIELLQSGRTHGYERLAKAVSLALELGCADAEAVIYLLSSPSLERSDSEPLDSTVLGELARYDRPVPVTGEYDRLVPNGKVCEVVS
jgi:transposase